VLATCCSVRCPINSFCSLQKLHVLVNQYNHLNSFVVSQISKSLILSLNSQFAVCSRNSQFTIRILSSLRTRPKNVTRPQLGPNISSLYGIAFNGRNKNQFFSAQALKLFKVVVVLVVVVAVLFTATTAFTIQIQIHKSQLILLLFCVICCCFLDCYVGAFVWNHCYIDI